LTSGIPTAAASNTAGCFNNTGSTVTLNGLSVPAYAFCPNVAGYYQVNLATNSNSTVTKVGVLVYKNSAIDKTLVIDLEGKEKGMYTYKVYTHRKETFAGKLIIR
jgi:hypothetical protein